MHLKDYLSENNLTQQKFADQIGVTQATVARWAGGVQFPHPIFLHKIEKATEGRVTPSDMVSLWVAE